MTGKNYTPLLDQELTKLYIREGFIAGNESLETFTSGPILKIPQISSDEIKNMWRTFVLYFSLPEEYFADIKKCEEDYEGNEGLFEDLVKHRWELTYS